MDFKVILTIANTVIAFFVWYQFGRESVYKKLYGISIRACNELENFKCEIELRDKIIKQLKDEIATLKGGKDETL